MSRRGSPLSYPFGSSHARESHLLEETERLIERSRNEEEKLQSMAHEFASAKASIQRQLDMATEERDTYLSQLQKLQSQFHSLSSTWSQSRSNRGSPSHSTSSTDVDLAKQLSAALANNIELERQVTHWKSKYTSASSEWTQRETELSKSLEGYVKESTTGEQAQRFRQLEQEVETLTSEKEYAEEACKRMHEEVDEARQLQEKAEIALAEEKSQHQNVGSMLDREMRLAQVARNSLEQEIKSLEKDNERLRNREADLTLRLTELAEQTLTLKDRIEDESERDKFVERLSNIHEVDMFENDPLKIDKDLQQMHSQLTEALSENVSLSEQLLGAKQDLKTTLKEWKQQETSLREQVVSMAGRADSLQAENERLRSRYSEGDRHAEETLSAKDRTIEALNERIHHLMLEHSLLQETSIDVKAGEMKYVPLMLKEFVKSKADMMEKLEHYLKERDMAQTEVRRMEQDLEKEKVGRKMEMEEYVEKNTELKRHLSEAEKEVVTKLGVIDSLNSRIGDLNDELNMAEERIKSLSDRKKDSENLSQTLRDEMIDTKAAVEAELHKYEDKLRDLEQQTVSHKNEIEELEHMLETSEDDIRLKETKMREMEEEMLVLKRALREVEGRELEQVEMSMKLQHQLSSETQIVVALKEEISFLTEKLSHLETDRDKLSEESQELAMSNQQQLLAQRHEIENEFRSWKQTKLEEFHGEKKKLVQEKRETIDRMNTLESELSAQERQIEDFQDQLRLKNEEIDLNKDSVRQHKEEIAKAKKEVADLEDLLSAEQRAKEEILAEKERLEKLLAERDLEHKELVDYSGHVLADRDAYVELMKEVDRKNTTLEVEISDLKRALDSDRFAHLEAVSLLENRTSEAEKKAELAEDKSKEDSEKLRLTKENLDKMDQRCLDLSEQLRIAEAKNGEVSVELEALRNELKHHELEWQKEEERFIELTQKLLDEKKELNSRVRKMASEADEYQAQLNQLRRDSLLLQQSHSHTQLQLEAAQLK